MRPLDGVRVLDLSRLIPGPFATLVLADLGASVDKVEDPGLGDYLRHFPPHAGGTSAGYQLLNRDKRSLVLDLKNPAGRDVFLELVGHYDVLVEQFRPGVLGRLGLGHEALLARHPRLVICAITGYGQTGPLAARAGHDLDFLARAGLLGATGPEDGPPQVPGFQLADVSGALWSVIAILAALRRRDATGEGGVCDIAMSEGALGFASLALAAGMVSGAGKRGAELLTGGIAPYRTYLAKDGAPMALAALEPKFWTAFAVAVGLEPDASALVPGPHQAAWIDKVSRVMASRTRAEWEEFATSTDVCLEPVLAPDELAQDEHLHARGTLFRLDVDGESVPAMRTPVTPRGLVHVPAAPAGRDGAEILREAGFTDAAVVALRDTGAIR